MSEPITPQAWWPEASRDWSADERQLLAQLDPGRLPAHVAIIMDGNGRWARQRGYLDRIRGHEAGIDSVREATRTCAQLRLQVLTLYAFSKENWRRPKAEIAALMELLRRFLIAERDELMDNNIRLLAIGSLDDLPNGARAALDETMRLTANNTGMKLVLSLSYGGRDELVRAARKLVAQHPDPAQINEAAIDAVLDTAGLPDPDLLVRTRGEMRVTNFLLWQIAYAVIFVTPVLWPDFRRRQLLEALADYQRRERRYGGVGQSTAPRG
ncbi:di-trans,poly-cis-decaprenylcistransferase [bacterium]|nr:di-trans,poly-cis-decaprenylcistransferase [bacterium]